MKNKLLILIICVFILSIVPIAHTYFQNGSSWARIPPSFVNDDLYYYARMNNIVNGYPFIGNPYYFEHRQEISPAFFISDWIATIPMKIGMPFILTISFNFIFWSILFSVFSCFLFIRYGLSKFTSTVGALVTYSTMYVLLLRPVSMQIVAPFFLLFCISYGQWLKVKTPSKLQNLFLIVTVALSFYIYTYSWQIVLMVLGLTALFLIYHKDWFKLKNLFIVGLCGGILGLPIILYALKQISSPYYWETMARIGLVNTHIPTALSFYDGGMILVILFLWWISFVWVRGLKDNPKYKEAFTFVSLLGLGLFFVSFSNLVTGKELEISNHIERFVIIWISVALVLYTWFLVKSRFSAKGGSAFGGELYELSYLKKLIVSILFIFSFIIFTHFFVNGFGIKSILQTDTKSAQIYAEPINWLNKNVPKESVVWSNGGIGYYLPIMSTDFQLFNPLGGLHIMSSKEEEERYLTSHYFDNLTLQDIKNDFRQYAGTGNSIHQYKTYNRKVKICQLLKLSYFGIDCGQITDAVSFRGEKYFVDLYNQYTNDIKPNIINKLKKFNVEYVVRDKRVNDKFTPEEIPNIMLLWSNDNFEIYSVKYK
ncbi:MAG: hypothetical protein WCW47_02240 [Candidatus Paceibacterota bacterium]